MKIISQETRIVIVSGKQIETIVYENSPNEFYVIGNRGKSGPFKLNDERFKLKGEMVS